MALLKYFYRRFRAIWRSDDIHREIKDEMRFHIEMCANENINRGMNREDAWLEAEKRFGNLLSIKEKGYQVRSGRGLEAIWLDIRCTWRVMKRRPGFSGVVIMTLALGIGVIITMFSVVDTVLIRSLPFEDSHRLVSLKEVREAGEKSEIGVAPGRLDDWNRLNKGFEAITGSYTDTLTDTSGSVPEQLNAAYVSPHFFSVFRVPPLLGRFFTEKEERYGGPSVIIINQTFWQQRFGSAPDIVGRKLQLANRSYTIVGVMPSTFQYPVSITELWLPKQADSELLQIREARFYQYCVGRLKPFIRFDQAWEDLKTVQAELGKQYPETDADWTVQINPLKETQISSFRYPLFLLFGSATILLLIACINVACLLLTQFSARVEEVAIRRTLGASHIAIARRLFIEGLAYALIGSVIGCLLTFIAVTIVKHNLPEFPRMAELTVNFRILLFVVTICMIVTILISFAPIIQSLRREDVIFNIGWSVNVRGHMLPQILVAAQIALAMVLLVGSSMFLKSLAQLQETALGFQHDQILTFRISASYDEDPELVAARHARTLDVLSTLPDVQAVAMANGLPGTISGTPKEFYIKEQKRDVNTRYYAVNRIVTSQYFQSLDIPIISGRTCHMDTKPQNLFEALVNKTFVDQYLQGRNAIGHSIVQGPQSSINMLPIVGVVDNVREAGYARSPDPTIYVCGYLRYWPNASFLIKTGNNPEIIVSTVRKAINEIEPMRAVYSIRPLTDVLNQTLSPNRFRAWLLSAFSAIALALAGIGLYGVSSYMVSHRIREYGIRMALGARPSQIWAEILSLGGWLAIIGVLLGIVGAYLTSQMISTLLYGVGTLDAGSYLYSAAVLCLITVLACLIPGKRAASIDPAQALREP